MRLKKSRLPSTHSRRGIEMSSLRSHSESISMGSRSLFLLMVAPQTANITVSIPLSSTLRLFKFLVIGGLAKSYKKAI
jgi:hypothetical protein